MLAAAGYRVALYAGGGEFLDSLGRERPACVLVDGQLPDMHGRDVLARLAACSARVPAIVVTGHDTAEFRRAAAACGAQGFFPKPFNAESLLATIARVIARGGQSG